MKCSIALSLFVFAVILSTASTKKPKVLSDSNFEHDTQATTGATTGDWLISFCDRQRHTKCDELDSTWAEIAGKLYGKVTVAEVDLNKSPQLKKRFKID